MKTKKKKPELKSEKKIINEKIEKNESASNEKTDKEIAEQINAKQPNEDIEHELEAAEPETPEPEKTDRGNAGHDNNTPEPYKSISQSADIQDINISKSPETVDNRVIEDINISATVDNRVIEDKPKRKRRTKAEIEALKQPEIPINTETEPTVLGDDEFKNLTDELSGAKKDTETPGEKKPRKKYNPIEANLITGYMLLFCIDSILPFLISFYFKRFRNTNLPTQAIKLTPEQFKQLEPIADQVAREMMFTIKPYQALLIMLSLSYFENGERYIYIESEQPKKIKKAKI
jgi:hypothetical protein